VLLLAALPSFYVATFVESGGGGPLEFQTWWIRLIDAAGFFVVSGISARGYRFLLGGSAALAVFFMVRVAVPRLRNFQLEPRDGVLFMSSLWMAAYLVAPGDFGGGHNFALRLGLVATVTLVAYSASFLTEGRGANLAACILVLTGSACLAWQAAVTLPVAREIGSILASAPLRPRHRGLVLYRDNWCANPFTVDPFTWAGVHYFVQTGATLLNSPFLYHSYMPLRLSKQHDGVPAARLQPDFLAAFHGCDDPTQTAKAIKIASQLGMVRMAWGNSRYEFFERPR
jgi:hypothetical protein